MKDLYIVTGAAGGMGEDAARRFKEYGDVLLLDLSEEKLNELAEELGEGAKALAFDITKKEDIEKVVEIVKEYGSFKALLHFAGVSEHMGNAEKIFDINLLGTINLLDALYDYAKAGTVIINTASMAAYSTAPTEESAKILAGVIDENANTELKKVCGENPYNAYGWSKKAVIELSRQSCLKWGEKGARIVSVSPGVILTDMVRHELGNGNNDGITALIQASAVKRMGEVADITNLCEFLCSDKAGFITGTDFLIDGGANEGFKVAFANFTK